MNVVITSMPWHFIGSPSIAVGILAALARARTSHDLSVVHANLDWAERCMERTGGRFSAVQYGKMTDEGHKFGQEEWIFAPALHGRTPWRQDEYFAQLRARGAEADFEMLAALHALSAEFVENLADRIAAQEPDVLAFSVTFMQHVASLALAKMVKARRPSTRVLFGGAGCEGSQGEALQRNFPFVDYVARGEGEKSFLPLLEAIERGAGFDDIPGLCWFEGGAQRVNPTGGFVPMNAVPMPDYDDFFERFNRSPVAAYIEPALVVESARGCWYGAVHHCTFCGLNGTSMTFRSKNPATVMHEITSIAARHQVLDVLMIDNILDMRYFDSLIPWLTTCGLDLKIHYESKANLKREQLYALEAAGIVDVQPGIEGLSTRVLKLMDKGVHGTRNVQVLRDAADTRISLSWNYLYGFPGETDDDHRRVLSQFPSLWHLKPPLIAGRIVLERFSPYFDRPELGFSERRPAWFFTYAYDLDDAALWDMVYLFEASAAGVGSELESQIQAALGAWKDAFARGASLLCWNQGEALTIEDRRRASGTEIYVMRGWQAAAYELLMEHLAIEALSRRLASESYQVRESELVSWLDRMTENGLVFTDDGRYVALATGNRTRRKTLPRLQPADRSA